MSSPASGLSTNTQGVLNGLFGGGLAALTNAFGTPSSGTVTTNSNTSGTSTPTYSSAVLPLYNQLLSSYMSNANGSGVNSTINAMQSQGQQNINQTSQGGTNAINNILAQRGQEYGPSGSTALVQQELARQGQQTSLNNQIPQLRYGMQQTALNNAGNFFSSLPHGTSTTGTSSGTQVTTQPQASWISGLLGGVASALPAALKLF